MSICYYYPLNNHKKFINIVESKYTLGNSQVPHAHNRLSHHENIIIYLL